MATIADHADRRLDAIGFLLATAAGDAEGMRAVSRSAGDLVAGLVSVLGSVLTGWSDAADIEPEAIIDQLRADAISVRDRYG